MEKIEKKEIEEDSLHYQNRENQCEGKERGRARGRRGGGAKRGKIVKWDGGKKGGKCIGGWGAKRGENVIKLGIQVGRN